MVLIPEAVEAYKTILINPEKYGMPFKPFADCFVKSETVTAKHILSKQYIDYINRDLPKVICYIIMDQLFGQCNGKDENGNLGYYLKLDVETEIKTGFKYHCHHVPSNEDWVVIGIKKNKTKICVAGYPPTIANFSDCTGFVEAGPLTEQEFNYRKKEFGEDWI